MVACCGVKSGPGEGLLLEEVKATWEKSEMDSTGVPERSLQQEL